MHDLLEPPESEFEGLSGSCFSLESSSIASKIMVTQRPTSESSSSASPISRKELSDFEKGKITILYKLWGDTSDRVASP